MSLHRLLPLFDRARATGQPLVLATVIRTGGSTYAKPGAQMLIAANGEYAGLLSGGCLEGDLREHARAVAASGQGRIVSYDMRSSTDQLFGLGAGCEGAMDVLLTRVGAGEAWQPLEFMAAADRRGEPSRVAFITASADGRVPLGLSFPDAGAAPNGKPLDAQFSWLREAARSAPANTLIRLASPDVELFVAGTAPPARLLLLGAGPDARPVAELASFLGWRVTAVDHRTNGVQIIFCPPMERFLGEARDKLYREGQDRLAEWAARLKAPSPEREPLMIEVDFIAVVEFDVGITGVKAEGTLNPQSNIHGLAERSLRQRPLREQQHRETREPLAQTFHELLTCRKR